VMTETKTYRGASLDDVLPQIRADLGDDALIIRQREGLVGGIGGFFAKRCVEVEAIPAPGRPANAVAAPVAMPARAVFDAYDSPQTGGPDTLDDDPEHTAAIRRLMAETAPFASRLEQAEQRFQPLAPHAATATVDTEPEPELDSGLEITTFTCDDPFEKVATQLIELGLPEAPARAAVREAERGMAPFDQVSSPEQLVRRALARQIKTEHGWKTKRRTIALIGPSGAGKTSAAAKLCHAYAAGSSLAVRTLSLEPVAGAYRLGQLTEHLDIGLRVADTPEAAKRAATRLREESLIVVDTPPVSAGDPAGIAALADLLAQVRPDETHLVLPATMDARAALALTDALAGAISISRLLVTRLDEAPTAAVAVGLSFSLKKPISYVAEGRRAARGLRPADPAELAELVLP